MIREDEMDGGPYIQFYIKDTGRGISQDKLSLIFNRFHQSEETYTKLSEGVGLGLPISKAYIELLGGKIWAKSEIGSGTEFYFIHPYKPGDPGTTFSTDVEPPEKDRNWENIKILVAEDNEKDWQYLKAVFRKTGAVLMRVENGMQAIETTREHSDIDIILMDLRMPGVSGYDATVAIKKMNKNIPIIVQTAFAREEDMGKILETGCDNFVVKPFKKEVLLDTIGRYI
jgi:hypothetical protein